MLSRGWRGAWRSPDRDQALERRGLRATGGPVEQLDRVQDRDPEPGLELLDAADIARNNDVRVGGVDVAQLAGAQGGGKFRLQDGIAAGRAASSLAAIATSWLRTAGQTFDPSTTTASFEPARFVDTGCFNPM